MVESLKSKVSGSFKQENSDEGGLTDEQKALDDIIEEEIMKKRYQQIDSYGVIGNMRTCAHVCGKNGSIDWFCYPHFNSPSIFARLLDHDKGGYFQVNVSDRMRCAHDVAQSYWPDTNMLMTKFSSKVGIGQVIDYMPVVKLNCGSKDPELFPDVADLLQKKDKEVRHRIGSASLMNTVPCITSQNRCEETDNYKWICRRIEVIQGSMTFKMMCFPAFNYARDDHKIYVSDDKRRVVFSTDSLSMTLLSSAALLDITNDGLSPNEGVSAEFVLTENACMTLVFRESTDEEIEEARQYHEKIKEKKQGNQEKLIHLDDSHLQMINEGEEEFRMTAKTDWLFIQTMNFWHAWIQKCNYQGRWREHIYRSALALKLMTFEPTGAIVAAPTTSLPESIGGTRNWDYRFTWVRDSAYVVYSFIRVGFYDEAECFIRFIEDRCKESITEELLEMGQNEYSDGRDVAPEPPLKSIYSINKMEGDLVEQELDHLEGYKCSRPVRIGNAAADQLQLDVYGELLDAIYLYNKYSNPVSYDFWRYIVYIVDWVCENYDRKDEGLWEVRGGKQHFLYSKVLCWVCIDRGLRLADKRSFPCPRVYWQKKRDMLMIEIMKEGFNTKVGAFTQYYGSENLDAGALILPLVLFMAPTDPRMISTLDAINRSPKKGGLVLNSLVFRYDYNSTDDGFIGMSEGTFNMCTFWLIECLARTAQKQKIMEARLKMEQFFTYLSSVGLFSEEMSSDGHQLGNYPQCFTHLALISSAFNLNRALNNWKPMTVNSQSGD